MCSGRNVFGFRFNSNTGLDDFYFVVANNELDATNFLYGKCGQVNIIETKASTIHDRCFVNKPDTYNFCDGNDNGSMMKMAMKYMFNIVSN